MKLISRRSAIMVLTKQMSDWNDDRNAIVEQCISAIRGLKVHDSKKHKTGRWNLKEIHNCYEVYQCDVCKREITVFHRFGDMTTVAKVTEDYPYCHCGAKMEVEE